MDTEVRFIAPDADKFFSIEILLHQQSFRRRVNEVC
jgi:hypothetical protein